MDIYSSDAGDFSRDFPISFIQIILIEKMIWYRYCCVQRVKGSKARFSERNLAVEKNQVQSRALDKVKRLVDIIFLTLRESVNLEKLGQFNEQFLCSEILRNPRILEILEEFESSGHAARKSGCGADFSLRALETLKDQRTRLLQDLEQVEREFKEFREFTHKSLLTFAGWVESSACGRHLTDSIRLFKKRLKKTTPDDIATLEKAFGELKRGVLLEGITDLVKPPEARPGFSLKRWFRRSRDSQDITVNLEQSWLSELKAILLTFIDGLELLSRNRIGPQVPDLKSKLEECGTLRDLLNLRDELVDFGHLCTRYVQEEREQVSRLIKDIDNNLRAIEGNLTDSLGHTDRLYQVNAASNRQLELRIDELNEYAQTSTDLEDLRQAIISKLTTLRQAIEMRRQSDERRLAELKGKMERLQRSIILMRQEVARAQKQRKELEEKLLIDPLTGILNRRGYEKRIAEEFERYRRYGHVVSLVVFDVDRFKEVNDFYGHSTGDSCLKTIAQYMRSAVRKSDTPARYGGDEFVLILPGIGRKEAAVVAEKIRRLVEQIRFIYKGSKLSLTLSIGVAEIQPDDEKPEDLFNRADQALYRAKQDGRNRVRIYEG